uniref:Prokineticin-like protein n=1 Tax=Pomacea canaliculata TaxID=400727 RepID=A0A1Q1NAY4_POMCA|nr:prokineticin-like protein [Pomacea canaliculata]
MKVLIVSVLAAIVLATCKAEVGKVCTSQSQCAADECCQIVNIVILSKKRELALSPVRNTSGTCQKYHKAGDNCNSFDVLNGYCSCAPGLTCTTVQVSTTPATAPLTAMKMAPGYSSFCTVA